MCRAWNWSTPKGPTNAAVSGGTFAVTEAAVSARMGHDKVSRQQASGAEFVVSADMSCLMHQAGCAARQRASLAYVHIAQVLNGS